MHQGTVLLLAKLAEGRLHVVVFPLDTAAACRAFACEDACVACQDHVLAALPECVSLLEATPKRLNAHGSTHHAFATVQLVALVLVLTAVLLA